MRYSTRVYAYLLLMANPWPPFTNSRPYPIDVEIGPGGHAEPADGLFRLLLAIPAFILSYVFRIVNTLIAFLTWFYALSTGRANEGMKNLSVWLLRYEVQTYAYVFLLTGRYPTLSDAPRVPAAPALELVQSPGCGGVSRPACAGAGRLPRSCRSAHFFVHYVTSPANVRLITN